MINPFFFFQEKLTDQNNLKRFVKGNVYILTLIGNAHGTFLTLSAQYFLCCLHTKSQYTLYFQLCIET